MSNWVLFAETRFEIDVGAGRGTYALRMRCLFLALFLYLRRTAAMDASSAFA